MIIRIFFVRDHASAAVFYALFIFIAEITAATLTQSIKGAETKQAVEFLWIFCFMTGKKFAFFMLEKSKLFFAAFAAFIIVFHFMLSPTFMPVFFSIYIFSIFFSSLFLLFFFLLTVPFSAGP